jgi:hypothetical protein
MPQPTQHKKENCYMALCTVSWTRIIEYCSKQWKGKLIHIRTKKKTEKKLWRRRLESRDFLLKSLDVAPCADRGLGPRPVLNHSVSGCSGPGRRGGSRGCPFGDRNHRGRPCRLGGFNVSNLMGITRRMIDIGKKITFYFLQNVWKCTVFFEFAF